MKTLKELVEGTKCRRGPATGTTKRGAYWLACSPIEIRSYGGNGIGNNGTDWDNTLELRHYRSGEVRATIHAWGWHENHGTQHEYSCADAVLGCVTAEEVIVALKGMTCGETHAYSNWGRANLVAALTALGLPEAEPAPDEVAA